ncbi:MAG: hypothetical protein KGI25_06045 [Thaumarchaeota archaeon]|nr:hypothetical protein [Nitrososphaerota archaeon]
MSGIDLNSAIDWLSKNGWFVVLTTGAILAGSYLTLFDRVGQYINRPKLTFEGKSEEESIDDPHHGSEKPSWARIRFWIIVKNEGKSTANHAHVFLKLTDESGQVKVPHKLSFYSTNESFPFSWIQAGTTKDVTDILPSKEHPDSFVRIPLRIDFPRVEMDETKPWKTGTYTFESPIESSNLKATSEDPNFTFIMKIEIEVSYGNNQQSKKQFIIRVKRSDMIERKDIEFYPVSD